MTSSLDGLPFNLEELLEVATAPPFDNRRSTLPVHPGYQALHARLSRG